MKKILIFSLNYYPFVGGAEVAIKEITDRLPAEKFEFHALVYRFDTTLPRQERIGNVMVHRIGIGKPRMTVQESFKPMVYFGKILYVPLAALKALSLHRIHRFDLFWAMMCYMCFPIVLLRLVGIRPPYVVTLQEGDPFERVFERWRIRIFAPLLRYGFKHASAVQAISTFLLNWSRTANFTGDGRVIPNGVDTTRFAQPHTPAEFAKARARLGRQEGDTLLITTSRLVHKNAIDDVLHALTLLPDNVTFAICGIGPEELMLQALTEKLGLTSRVRFLGQCAHEELPLLLAACDIFVRPSRSEGMGNSFIEAMAVGLPVIATQEGGIADFLFDATRNPDREATGWAVDVDSPQQIAQTVAYVLAHPEERRATTEHALSLVVERYDWNLIAKDMKKLFDEMFIT